MSEIEVSEPQTGTLALTGNQTEWTPVQRAALSHLGIEDAPPGDQQVFMHIAQRTGLDPFARQLYMIPRQEGTGQNRKTKWTIQTGIDGFRLIAERHPQYRGQVGPQWCGDDGVWTDVWLSSKPPVAARVGILRADRDGPIWGTAMFREYAQTKTWDGRTELTKMWREKGAHMVAKCAEALGFRKAFPVELGGLHTEDEMAGIRSANREPEGPASAPTRVTVAELTGATVIDAEPAPAPEAPAQRRPARTTKTSAPGKTRASAGAAQTAADPTPPTGPPPADTQAADPDAAAEDVELADRKQHRAMHKLWREADVTERTERLLVTQLLLGRVVDTSKSLTPADADAVIGGLNQLVRERRKPLAAAVDDLLQEYAARAGEHLEEPDPRDEDGAGEQAAAVEDVAES